MPLSPVTCGHGRNMSLKFNVYLRLLFHVQLLFLGPGQSLLFISCGPYVLINQETNSTLGKPVCLQGI